MEISVRRLDADLPLPARAHPGDAGVDLVSRIDLDLRPGEWAMVPTGIAVAIPEGHVGLVAPRSGLAARHGIGVVNGPGIVDAGFRGEVNVLLINHGTDDFAVVRGDRIAQLLVVPCVAIDLVEADVLPDSSRGTSGFGSTGR